MGPSPSEVDQYRAFLATIGPEARARRARIGTTAIAAVLVLGAGAHGGHLVKALGAVGLILDIGGAGLLTLGLLMSNEMLGEMGAMRWGGNDAALLGSDQDRRRLALAMLTLGFVGQIPI